LLKQLGHGGQTPPAEKINGNRRQGYISDINNSRDHIDNWNVNVNVILNWNVSIWHQADRLSPEQGPDPKTTGIPH
jgi:hypothetical protein